jgi:hypothetical protein
MGSDAAYIAHRGAVFKRHFRLRGTGEQPFLKACHAHTIRRRSQANRRFAPGD